MLQAKSPEDVRGHYVQTRGQVQNLWDVNSSEQVLVDARICHNILQTLLLLHPVIVGVVNAEQCHSVTVIIEFLNLSGIVS